MIGRRARGLGAAVGAAVVLVGLAGCGMILNRSAETIRRQQNRADPFATGEEIGTKRKPADKPARAIVHSASYDAADGLVDGALDAISEPKRREQLDALGDSLELRVGGVSKTAGESIIVGIGEKVPALRPVLAEMIGGLKSDLHLDPEGTARRVTRAALSEAGDGMRTELRPQIRKLVSDDIIGSIRGGIDQLIGPQLQERVRDHVVPAMKELTKDAPQLAEDLGKGAAKGLGDGIAASLDTVDPNSLGSRIKALMGDAKGQVDDWLSRALLLALVVAFAAIVVAVFKWLGERSRRQAAVAARVGAEEQAKRHERMLELVTAAIHQVGAKGSLEDFRETIKALSSDGPPLETRAALNEFLTRRKLKLETPRA